MREAVSDILVDRSRMADGLSRMVTYSFIAHAALLSVVYFVPARWLVPQQETQNALVMTIELGGTPGQATGGMTSISTSPVQQVAATEAKPAPQPAPAAPAPEMVLPSPTTKPVPKPLAKPIEKPQDKSASRKPTTGPEVRSGSAKYETGGAPTPFGGLTTGGGGAGGARVDVQNFCCPAYLVTMTQLIRSNWNQNQGATGEVEVKFTILRDGTIVNADVETSSGLFNLDQEARRALAKTRKLPPLPREFTESTLPVHLVFRYNR
jgi:TonB family protein